MNNIKKLWGSFARQIDIPDRGIDASFHALQERYSLPRRHYHTLSGHIRQCIDLFRSIRHAAIEPLAVEAALWTHDAYYCPGASDNEEQSGIWMRSFFERFGVRDKNLVDRIANLISATSHREAPNGNDAELVADIDLTILGALRKDFDRYEVGIRNEYAWVPWPVFAEKRASVLKKFLDRPAIYHHRVFLERYERRARRNLSRSIRKLQQHQPTKARE
jgi:predicted metal-dependent HD superfamily phosphohydrolase